MELNLYRLKKSVFYAVSKDSIHISKKGVCWWSKDVLVKILYGA